MTAYLLQHFLDEAADRFPDNTALVDCRQQLSYFQLNKYCNQLANYLEQVGVSRQDRVMVFCNRSVESIIAIFGILKSNAIYIPVDFDVPVERLRYIFQDCTPKVAICCGEICSALQKLKRSNQFLPPTFLLKLNSAITITPLTNNESQFFKKPPTFSEAQPLYQNVDTDLAYIMYTSGSTGKPKGVMISHLNVRDYIDWAVETFSISRTDCILNTAPLFFDMSTFDIFATIKAGAKLIMADELCCLFPGKLIQLIEKHRVNLWKGVSSLLMYMARSGCLKPGRLNSLKKVLFGGEALAKKYLIQWMETYPEKQYYNMYGPTEATGVSVFHHLQKIPASDTEPIPIGKPCRNTEIIVLNTDNQPAESGELCIRGCGVSAGYWNDASATEAVFITNPISGIKGDRIFRSGDIVRKSDDGVLELIGRKDNQVKFMGYRIDLTEIETTLTTLTGVHDAAVVLVRSASFELNELVAFVELSPQANLEEIKRMLVDRLPRYMAPNNYFQIDRIPRSERGKLDRKALTELAKERLAAKLSEFEK
ncbi:MAG TPA: amino acid adenylation domain-containing protein [bacterium]|nr:amino acid adenylation domain-containing protein [bacterium]